MISAVFFGKTVHFQHDSHKKKIPRFGIYITVRKFRAPFVHGWVFSGMNGQATRTWDSLPALARWWRIKWGLLTASTRSEMEPVFGEWSYIHLYHWMHLASVGVDFEMNMILAFGFIHRQSPTNMPLAILPWSEKPWQDMSPSSTGAETGMAAVGNDSAQGIWKSVVSCHVRRFWRSHLHSAESHVSVKVPKTFLN